MRCKAETNEGNSDIHAVVLVEVVIFKSAPSNNFLKTDSMQATDQRKTNRTK